MKSSQKRNGGKNRDRGKGGSPRESAALHLRSSIRYRQRWKVGAILRRPHLARALEESLSQNDRILSVRANPVSGGVLIIFRAEEPSLDVESLLRNTLESLSRQAAPSTDAQAGAPPVVRILKRFLPERKEVTGPVMLSIAGHLVHILQGHSFVATVSTARGEGPRFLKWLGIENPRSRLFVMGGLSLLLTAADLFIQYHRKKAWHRIAQQTRHNLRTELISKIQSQDLEFFDRHGTGRLIHLVTNETAQIAAFIEQAGDEVIEKAAIVIVSGGILLKSSPVLALLGGLPLPLGILLTRLLEPRIAARYSRVGELGGRFNQMIENNLPGIATVKSFTAEDLETDRLSDCDAEMKEALAEAESAATLLSVFSQGAFMFGLSVATGYGGRLVGTGKISQGDYLRAMYWFPQMVIAFTGIERLGRLYRSTNGSASSLLEVLDSEPEISSGTLRLDSASARGEVVFENVSFAYDKSFKVLNDVSFRLPVGETLAIVGPTGSGKSSLLRLLLRFYEVDSGRILVDGTDIRDLNLEDLRRTIGFVSQEVYLFEGSVKDNLSLGAPDASVAQLTRAMLDAGAGDVLESQPGGLEAEVGERGGRLSGGARQRVAIARALVKGAPILALDEATSQLDYKTESSVKHHLRPGDAAKSIIIVAHRLAAIRDADKIIVLDGGQIREEGTHEQLLSLGGLYASIWNLQNGEGPSPSNLEIRIDRPRDA